MASDGQPRDEPFRRHQPGRPGHPWRGVVALAAFLFLWSPARLSAQTVADLRAQAFELAYNLDRDRALELLREASATRPDDASLHRGIASLVWLEILFQRGAVGVDELLGSISKQNVKLPPPAPALAADFERHARRAVDLARARLRTDARSVEAHYELGAAEGLLASYVATVQGKFLDALGNARRAYDAHEKVLELDSRRKDAGLVVGTYRYVVGSLSLPLRLLAYVVGFGGGKQRGLAFIEEAATYPGDAQPEAQFALLILYNREERYDDALRVANRLQEQYPRNRLLWLEAGSTALRANRADLAQQLIAEGLTRLARDTRPLAFGEAALWRHKQGVALARLRRTEEAETALRSSLTGEARNWVRGRSYLELGRLAAQKGDRDAAAGHFRQAVTLCSADNDRAMASEARRQLDEVKP